VELVSRRSKDDGGRGADADSRDPAISADGLSVAFETYAKNLGGPVDGQSNVYVYDRDRDRVALVSRQSAADGGQGGEPGGAGTPSISADGRFVAFWTNDENLGGPKTAFNAIYVYDRAEREVTLVSRQSAADGGEGAVRSAYDPSISADGRFIAFFTYAGNLGGPSQFPGNVYVYDLQERTVELASRQSVADGGVGVDGLADAPSISADGRLVSFLTQATNLGGAIQATRNVYVYDRAAQRVELASRQSAAAGGLGADADSKDPALAGDGSSAAFSTRATNLGGPIRDVANVYRHERGG
jgi:Tol biopolymer transport system component